MVPIYLDNHATTKVDERVLEAMLPWLRDGFGNASSKAHAWGRRADDAVHDARLELARAIGARPEHVVFTSGATESINLAIRGIVAASSPDRRHVVSLATEHKAVLDSCAAVQRDGGDATVLGVGQDGRVDLGRLAAAITDHTAVVAIMAVNNEIGVVQDLAAIGSLCAERGAVFFCDAAQAPGRLAIDVDAMQIGAMSMTAHKCYGPKGAGALYLRRDAVQLQPLTVGGGQEFGVRSGTLATHQIVGLARSISIAQADLGDDDARIAALRQRLWSKLRAGIEGISLNGSAVHRVAGNLNVAIPCADANTLMMMVPELGISSGSACASGATKPSHVLSAIGLDDELGHCCLRFGIGRFNTPAEIDAAAELVIDAVAELRAQSPLWRMRKAGIEVAW